MKFTMSVETGNAAFGDEIMGEFTYELRRILIDVAERVNVGQFHPGHTQSILDANGNRVGSFKIGPVE